MSALDNARAAVQAKVDSALDAMPPRSRERTEIDLQVPIAALRTLLAATAPPTDDEREALRGVLFYDDHGRSVFRFASPRVLEEEDEFIPAMIPAVLAAGFRRRGPITDEAVDAAARSNYRFQHRICVHDVPDWSEIPENDPFKGAYREEARAALEAAEAAR